LAALSFCADTLEPRPGSTEEARGRQVLLVRAKLRVTATWRGDVLMRRHGDGGTALAHHHPAGPCSKRSPGHVIKSDLHVGHYTRDVRGDLFAHSARSPADHASSRQADTAGPRTRNLVTECSTPCHSTINRVPATEPSSSGRGPARRCQALRQRPSQNVSKGRNF
jgi:hypothetical protein